LDTALIDAFHQRWDMEIFWGNPIQRRELPAKAVVKSFERAGSFQRNDICRLLDDAEHGGIAPRIIAYFAAISGGKKSTNWARDDFCLCSE